MKNLFFILSIIGLNSIFANFSEPRTMEEIETTITPMLANFPGYRAHPENRNNLLWCNTTSTQVVLAKSRTSQFARLFVASEAFLVSDINNGVQIRDTASSVVYQQTKLRSDETSIELDYTFIMDFKDVANTSLPTDFSQGVSVIFDKESQVLTIRYFNEADLAGNYDNLKAVCRFTKITL